ncbi:response regulator [Motiliproteus sp. MSK22-1]|uniref:response regulator n=1 Tax=Motiliproteus sp. MSK22-1 TaxID=1897630 RepID=UPI000977054D|nr:response regulator [Motiliproteus sp. MSK22-1]OMH25587.1 hypothetical protein BGP75_23850 [Motiliproteus sp. MSK22-1]
MATQVLICDDSGLARKVLARSLPEGLNAAITYASNGQEAVEAIRKGQFDLMFLDLTMPVMDGYEVLETLNKENRMFDIVVVSGDIQAEAQKRVLALGARDFIKKPCSKETLTELLPDIGYPLDEETEEANIEERLSDSDIDPLDRIGEISNVAMGRAASLLADILEVFVVLPIPLVNEVESSELQMAVAAIGNSEEMSAVCQGFIGSRISGEAFLMIHDGNISELAKMMGHDDYNPEEDRIEVIMDMANVLISASLKGFEEQLDLRFSRGHPTVLDSQDNIDKLLAHGAHQWKKTLAIEFDYRIEDHDIQCTLMLLFSENSIQMLHNRTAYIG